jgi:hypothetical protein
MSRLRWTTAAAALAVAAAGCANPSLAPEADDLRDEVAGLPGVVAARLDYTEPVTLDSGKVVLKVAMSGTATHDQVVDVADAAYDAFRSTHHDEEADLAVSAGRITVAIRSFEPEASVTAVGDAVRTGLAAAPEGGSVAIDLTTQDVEQGDHVAGTYVVTLPDGSTSADVPGRLASLEADRPDDDLVGWGVAAADGSSLTYDHGFPPARLVDRWRRLQTAGVPTGVRALADGSLFVTARPATAYDVADPDDRRALDRITHAQLRVLGGGGWVYDLDGPDGARLAEVDRYTCEATSEGAYDDALEAWVGRRLGACPAP